MRTALSTAGGDVSYEEAEDCGSRRKRKTGTLHGCVTLLAPVDLFVAMDRLARLTGRQYKDIVLEALREYRDAGLGEAADDVPCSGTLAPHYLALPVLFDRECGEYRFLKGIRRRRSAVMRSALEMYVGKELEKLSGLPDSVGKLSSPGLKPVLEMMRSYVDRELRPISERLRERGTL